MSASNQRLRAVMERELRSRGYDKYPAEEELFEDLLDDLVGAVVALTGGVE